MEEWDAKIIDKINSIVEITFKNEKRTIRIFSPRAARTLVELTKAYPDGVTKKDMDRITDGDLHDNKMFDELITESCLSEFMIKDGRRDKVDLRKLEIEELWKAMEKKEQPVWFGVDDQNDVKEFREVLIEKQGYSCNISGIPLIGDIPRHTFAGNVRREAIDHRRPKYAKGKTEEENLQILAYYFNERKRQICSKCPEPQKCEECALAFPEKASIVYPTKEDISVFGAFKDKHMKKWWKFW